MKQLKQGQYFGDTDFSLYVDGLTITDTVYTHEYVDWHHHENPYFTLLMDGKLLEENKKEQYHLKRGSLLFHNWQDAHRNVKPPEYTRGFHLEINTSWFDSYDIDLSILEGSICILDPRIKNALYAILLEAKKGDIYSEASLHMLTSDALTSIQDIGRKASNKEPRWFGKLKDLLYDSPEPITLSSLSKEVGVHPVHLSRTFHRLTGMTFGNYCRELRLNRVVEDINSGQFSMTDIAYRNQYCDQSHMISAFRKRYGITPLQFKNAIG